MAFLKKFIGTSVYQKYDDVVGVTLPAGTYRWQNQSNITAEIAIDEGGGVDDDSEKWVVRPGETSLPITFLATEKVSIRGDKCRLQPLLGV